MAPHQQLLLGLSDDDNLTLEGFYLSGSAQLLVETLRHNIQSGSDEFLLVTGNPATGKTHLLRAACLYAHQLHRTNLYLPLKELKTWSPEEVLSGLDDFWWLSIDDVDTVADDMHWQWMLFQLYNRRKESGQPLFFSMVKPVHFASFTLKDLQSRLSACPGFHLSHLSDEEKVNLLQLRALKRGMKLNEACAAYIIQRSERDLAELIRIIDQLDQATLQAGRKLTVPFIKSVLNW